jgi:hypothetical protein
MTSITITLPDERMAELSELASQVGISPEQLVLVSIDELFTKREGNFRDVIEYLLEKNADLYKRLA